ncbi:MAG: hypothetical protein HeimC2_06470 [Candidatus Heimdallarchaeota archaeon LC_2]|nr:MAG: hypothetical protein HeimC2_06470 [Candidatus Heimdallarchaeota archaeon LC_2]
MKSPIFYFIITFLLLFSVTNSIVAHEEHRPEGPTSLIYDVTFSNEANNIWYDSILNEASTYHILNNTQVLLNVTEISDPQSSYDITIGNVTKTDVPDYMVEEVLALGYYSLPRTFGFIANTTWLDTKAALEVFADGNTDFQLTEFSFPRETLLGGELHTTLIEYSDSFQSTSLVYEQESGILLRMNSTAGGFSLSMSIQSINDNTEYYFEEDTTSSTTTDDTPISIFFSLIGVSFLFYLFKRNSKFN